MRQRISKAHRRFTRMWFLSSLLSCTLLTPCFAQDDLRAVPPPSMDEDIITITPDSKASQTSAPLKENSLPAISLPSAPAASIATPTPNMTVAPALKPTTTEAAPLTPHLKMNEKSPTSLPAKAMSEPIPKPALKLPSENESTDIKPALPPATGAPITLITPQKTSTSPNAVKNATPAPKDELKELDEFITLSVPMPNIKNEPGTSFPAATNSNDSRENSSSPTTPSTVDAFGSKPFVEPTIKDLKKGLTEKLGTVKEIIKPIATKVRETIEEPKKEDHMLDERQLRAEIIERFLERDYNAKDIPALFQNPPKSNAQLPTHLKRADLQHAACEAAARDDLTSLRALVDMLGTTEIKDRYGATLLTIAAINNRVDAVRLLLAKGAKVNIHDNEGHTPLSHAVKTGNLEIISALLVMGADRNLLDQKVIPALDHALDTHHDKIIDSISTPENKHALLHPMLFDAVAHGDILKVEMLLAKGADINARNRLGNTPLLQAAILDQLSVMTYLIKKGADVNVRTPNGQTAAMILDQRNALSTPSSNATVRPTEGRIPLPKPVQTTPLKPLAVK